MTERPPKRIQWLLIRLLLYVGIAAFLLTRGVFDRNPLEKLPVFAPSDTSLTIAGKDLAPELIQALADAHQRDYPAIRLTVEGGGTAKALEALANRKADIAFLTRPPGTEEQALFQASRGDTMISWPVAVGGLLLLRNKAGAVESTTLEELRSLVLGESRGMRGGPFYVPDPNLGLWTALGERLGVPVPFDRPPAGVFFLTGESGVISAVRADQAGIGLLSSLSAPPEIPGLVPVLLADTSGMQQPTEEAIASSRYPLYHYLYVAMAKKGSIEASMFVTSLTSDRGQRQIERAGYLPARRVLREVVITKGGPGEGS